jgi:chromosome segregation ATPase
MNTPTTRETADHAELLAKLKTNDPTNPAHRLARDLQAGHRLGTEAGNDLIEVLSEIEALRGEMEQTEEKLDDVSEQCSRWIAKADEEADRATQAERQRDELRKALGDVLFVRKDNPKASDRWMLEEIHRISRIALANQGDDQ